MKRIFSCLLVLIFLVNLLGWQWLFVRLQDVHQQREWSSLLNNQNDEIIAIKITNENKVKVNLLNSHELTADGKLYDIKQISYSAETTETVFYCTEDHTEEALLGSLNVVEKNNFSENGSVGSKVTKVVKPISNDYVLSINKPVAALKCFPIFTISVFSKLSDPFSNSVLMPPETV